MRQAAIWITGTLAAAIFGLLIGAALVKEDGSGGGAGFVAGALAFICFRLWRTSAQQKTMPVFDLKNGKLDRP